MDTTTWADGFGRWHASVLASGSQAKDAAEARRAIRAELTERYAPNFGPWSTLHVTREYDPRTMSVMRVDPHGRNTVHYREV